jgi:hypothetical protein
VQTPRYSFTTPKTFRAILEFNLGIAITRLDSAACTLSFFAPFATVSFKSTSALFQKHRGYALEKRSYGEAAVLAMVRFPVPDARAGAVGIHQAGDEHGEEEHAEDGLHDRKRSRMR